jgi:hypothetical protein
MALSANKFTVALRIASRRYPALIAVPTSRARIGCKHVRCFSHSPQWQIRTKELNDDLMKDLKVNQARLMEDIHHTCQWGIGEPWGEYVVLALDNHAADDNRKSTETGMSRLALSDADKAARDWFAETTKSLGCEVTVDAMGNQFAVRLD